MAHRFQGSTTILLAILVLFSLTCVALGEDKPSLDGPAELPRVYVQTDLKNTPSPLGAIHSAVNPFDALQAALKNARCGEVIQIQSGAAIMGNVQLPIKPCDDDHWIVIRTSAAD